jgi:hypothetical protein
LSLLARVDARLHPNQLLELCQESLASHALRHACDL